MKNLKEKIGYGFGDMASSMFWNVRKGRLQNGTQNSRRKPPSHSPTRQNSRKQR